MSTRLQYILSMQKRLVYNEQDKGRQEELKKSNEVIGE